MSFSCYIWFYINLIISKKRLNRKHKELKQIRNIDCFWVLKRVLGRASECSFIYGSGANELSSEGHNNILSCPSNMTFSSSDLVRIERWFPFLPWLLAMTFFLGIFFFPVHLRMFFLFRIKFWSSIFPDKMLIDVLSFPRNVRMPILKILRIFPCLEWGYFSFPGDMGMSCCFSLPGLLGISFLRIICRCTVFWWTHFCVYYVFIFR